MKATRKETVIVIDRHGQTTETELTGWRRWLAIGTGYLVFALVVLVGVALLLGLAMTFAMVLMVAVPLALVLALIAYATGYLKVGKFDVRP
jgi:peptidoglycan/LPS O-acetylase OafA/YrhL